MSPDEAAQAVYDALSEEWEGLGPLAVGEVYEDAEGYLVEYGNRQAVKDDDPRFVMFDLPVAFVDKWTGAVTFEPMLDHESRIDAMKPA